MKTIKGLFDLKYSLPVRADVLDARFSTVIKDIPITLLLPRRPLRNEERPGFATHLVAPDGFRTWKKGNEPIDWGNVCSTITGSSFVNVLGVVIELEENDVAEKCRDVYSAIEEWEGRFTEYLRLACKKYYRGGKDVHCGLTLLNSDGKLIPSYLTSVVMIGIYGEESYATIDILQKAIEFASSEKSFKSEYEMLVAVYEARKNNRNRQMVTDACAALELTIIRKIRDCCAQQGINADELLERVRMLGKRFDKLKQLDLSCPFTSIQDVLDLRDDMMHGRIIYPTDAQVDQLVKAVEPIIEYYSPAYTE